MLQCIYLTNVSSRNEEPAPVPSESESRVLNMQRRKAMKKRSKYLLLFISAFMIMILAAASVNADTLIHKGKKPAVAAKKSAQPRSSVAKPKVTSLYNCTEGVGIKMTCADEVWTYDIYRYDGHTTEYIGWAWGDDETYIDDEVKYKWGKSYVYSVVAWDYNYDTSPRSNKPRIMRLAPVKFTYKQAKSWSTIQLKWKSTVSGSNVTGYEIEYAKSKDDLRNKKGSFKKTVVKPSSVTSGTLTGLSSSTLYWFRARAYRVYTVNGNTKKSYSAYTGFTSVKTLSKAAK